MALGTVTLVKHGVLAPGGLRYVVLEVQPTSGANYTANGESLPLSNFKNFRRAVYFAAGEPKDEVSSDHEYTIDLTAPAAPKLVAMVAATAVEAAGSADLSSRRARIFAVGE